MNIEKKLCSHISWLRSMGRFNDLEHGCCDITGFTYNSEDYVFCNVKKVVAIFKFKNKSYTINSPTVLKESLTDLKSRALVSIAIVDGKPQITESTYAHTLEEKYISFNFDDLNLLDDLTTDFVCFKEVDEKLLKYIDITQQGNKVILTIKKEFGQSAYSEKRTLLNSKFEFPNKFYTYGDINYIDRAISAVYQNVRTFKADLKDRLNNAKHIPDPSVFLKEITNLLDRVENL